MTISDGTSTITKKSIILSKAINNPTTEKDIKEKLSKLGNTPFEIKNINIEIENVFIPLKILNEIRHELIDELIKKRTKSNNNISFQYKKNKTTTTSKNTNILVRNEKQLLAIKNKANIIYTDNYELYKKYKNLNIYYRLPCIMNTFPNYKNEKLLINELGSLNKYYKYNKIITDYTLNIANSESVKLMQEYNAKIVALSPEIPNYDILKYTNNTEIITYGKIELMIIKNFHLNYNNLTLIDKFGNKFKIINKDYCTILHSKNINIPRKNIKTNTRIILLDESINEIDNIIKHGK